MRSIRQLREIRIWYTCSCRRLGIPTFGPIAIFLLTGLFFILSGITAKPCIPKEDHTRVAAIEQKKVEQEENGTDPFSFDFCALQWKLFLKTLDKPRLHR